MVDTNKIILDLQEYAMPSEGFIEKKQIISSSIKDYLSENIDSLKGIKRWHIISNLKDLQGLKGTYEVLDSIVYRKRRENAYTLNADTMDLGVSSFLKKIDSLKGVLAGMYDSLHLILKLDTYSRKTKETTTQILCNSPFYKDMEYVFNNERELRFFDRKSIPDDVLGMSRFYIQRPEFNRTAMECYYNNTWKEYYTNKKQDWRIIPFIIDRSNTKNINGSWLESVILSFLLEDYKNKPLMISFILNNSNEENKIHKLLKQKHNEK